MPMQHVKAMKAIRLAENLSQSEFASKLNITQGTLSKIESRAITDVSFSIVKKLVEVFGLSFDELASCDIISYQVPIFKQKLMPVKYLEKGLLTITSIHGFLRNNPYILGKLNIHPLAMSFKSILLSEQFISDLQDITSANIIFYDQSKHSFIDVIKYLQNSNLYSKVESSEFDSMYSVALYKKKYIQRETNEFVRKLTFENIKIACSELLSFEETDNKILVKIRC